VEFLNHGRRKIAPLSATLVCAGGLLHARAITNVAILHCPPGYATRRACPSRYILLQWRAAIAAHFLPSGLLNLSAQQIMRPNYAQKPLTVDVSLLQTQTSTFYVKISNLEIRKPRVWTRIFGKSRFSCFF
jgi:hypothetical protein